MPKEKLTLYLEPEHIEWLESQTDEEHKVSAVVRNLIRKAMKVKSRKKNAAVPMDLYGFSTIHAALVPDELKDCADLIVEWWPIRKQKGAVNSTKVANRIFDKLMSFPSQDRKQALENAITAGWKDIYPLKKGYKPEEPKNNHPASRVFTAERGFE
tara:strand:- start:753 stop:1220 length:468 start_codon:yes stop_codon:yes gene_type:complete